MGESGREFVEREFSRRTWAERYLQLLVRSAKPSRAYRGMKADTTKVETV